MTLDIEEQQPVFNLLTALYTHIKGTFDNNPLLLCNPARISAMPDLF